MKQQSIWAAWVGLISNIVLTVVKLVVGFLCKSQVLIADGIHNAGDIVASVVAFGSMKVSSAPPDKEHPYGHGKAEVLGSYFVAGVLALAGFFMLYHSFHSLFQPAGQVFWLAFWIAALSLVWKYVLYVYTIRIGREENSKAMIATANDHLADVYASIAAVLGIGFGLLGQALDVPLLAYGDPLSGIIVSFFVLKLAYDMANEAIHILMERVLTAMKEKVAVQRLGSPRDVANAYVFLASEEASYVNGSVLSVDGGLAI